jgi:putative ABC transport system permease protein
MTHIQEISPMGLLLALVLMGIAIALMAWEGVPLKKELVIATIRTIGQLLLVGIILETVFQTRHWAWVLGYLLIMLLVASKTIYDRARKQKSRSSFRDIGLSVFIGAGFTIFWVGDMVISIHPWYAPQYLIPLAGMILGNSMNSAALGIDRFQSELQNRKHQIETLLALGATPRIAADESLKAAITAGMIPNINAMMIVGIVSLPGMMTGQILAGQSPLPAVMYQIVVMFMITCASAVTMVILLHLSLRKSFNQAEQLIDA